MSMKSNFLFVLCVFGFAAAATAQNLRTVNMRYEASYNPPAKDYLAASLIPLKFDGRFEVRYLLGEPVVNCTARWQNNHQLSVNTPGGDVIIAQPGDVEVYNLMLVAQLWDPARDKKRYGDKGGHIAAFCDAGIVAQNDSNGFNVAGSPNWDKFLCNLPSKFTPSLPSAFAAEKKQGDLCEEAGGTWFSAEAAKKIARESLKFEDVTIKSLEVNTGDAIRRYEKAQWRDKSFAYKESKAIAIGQRLKQKSPGSTVAGTQVSQMRLKKAGRPATPNLLKDYDSTLSSLQNMLQDGAAFAAQWREKDEQLVREQLVHIRAIEPNIMREEAKLTEYRKLLEGLQNDYLKRGRFDLLDIVPTQDTATQLWGYQAKSTSSWIIKPTYITAEPFDENGTANVIISQEQISVEKVTVDRKCTNRAAYGRRWQMLFDRYKYRQKSGAINFKNEIVSDVNYSVIQRDKNITPVGDCY